MTTSRSFGQLATRLKVRAAEVPEGMNALVKRVALRVDQVAVLATPVDTGRARNNWVASVGAPLGGERGEDKTGSEALQLAAQAIATYEERFGPIFLTNNVPYITALENGSSAQAPAGMTAQAIAAGAALVPGTRLLKG